MTAQRRTWLKSITICGTILGVIVGLATLGWTMPWQAARADTVAATYETKEHAAEAHARLERQQTETLQQILDAINSLKEK